MKYAVIIVSASLALASIQAPTLAQTERTRAKDDPDTMHITAPLSPKARGALARQFVLRWGNQIERVYNVKVGIWASRMIPTFTTADSANFRKALQHETLETALAELDGRGHRLSDGNAVERLARQASAVPHTMRSTNRNLKSLGSTSSDLTFTPVQPCRIVDTRIAGGQIAADGTRDFRAVSASNYTAQGGSATDCGLSAIAASAIALNVTAVTPAAGGFATIYSFDSTRPPTASVNYSAGSVVNNAIIARIPNPLQSSDFTLYTFAQAHYVIDIVGYFAPPKAAALQCVNTTRSQLIEAGGIFNMSLPACPEGFVITGAGCGTAGFNQANLSYVGVAGEFAQCIGTNITAGQIGILGTARCCRIPGR